MASASGKTLRVVVVTPERAVLDEAADMVVLPLFDGEFGVQPGHSPFVGQLGPGELRITAGKATRRYFVDGGFAQMREGVVNVLTPKATAAADLTPDAATTARAAADAMPVTNSAEAATKHRAVAKAQGMARVAAKGTE